MLAASAKRPAPVASVDPAPASSSPISSARTAEPEAASHTAVLRDLRDDLDRRGYFIPSTRYALQLGFWLPLFVVSYAALLYIPFGIGWAGLSLVAALGWLQMGFVGHDAGHYALSKRPWVNDFWGDVTMSLLHGISFGHWRPRHNDHHIHCQEEAGDPDMQFGLFLSVYPGSGSWRSAAGRFFLRIQRFTFWPLTSIYWASLRFDALHAIFLHPRYTRRDRYLLPLHYLLLVALPCFLVGAKVALITYVVLSSITAVMTASVFIPNHIGMRRLVPGQRLSYLEQQVSTSRNIDNPGIFDFYFGGLNSQIEHHLFPRVQQHRLRSMRPIVRTVCEQNGLAYRQESFRASLAAVVNHLGDITRMYKAQAAPEPGAAPASLTVGSLSDDAAR